MTVAVPVPAREGAFSLERRLMLRLGSLYVAAMLIVLTIYLVLAASYRHIHAIEDVDAVVVAVAGAVGAGADGGPALAVTPALRRALERVGDGGLSVIDTKTGRDLVTPALAVRSPSAAAEPPRGYDGDFFIRARDGTTLYRAAREVDTPAGRVRIDFERRTSAASEARAWLWEELGTETFPVLLPLLVATLLISWLTLRSALRPLWRIAEEAQGIAVASTGMRLGMRGVPREILPVVTAANGALDRVEAGLRGQQRLMANVAHELRTPLAILRARIESLNMPAVDATVLPDFDRVARMVSRLLAVARLQSEHIAFDQRYDVVRTTRQCLAQMAPLALAQNKELAMTADDAPIVVRGNPTALADAIRNLVDNALRFTSPGQAVEITVLPGCAIEVRDHGPGISAAAEQRIFERFWRGEESGGGVGLGLAIATETAKRHAGRLCVANAPDGGAVFRIELPQVA